MVRRQTPSKSAILNILKEAGVALSHDMVREELEKEMDRSTIYRVLNRFHEDGLVHKVVCDDGKQYFAYCIDCEDDEHQHNHFHFRCTRCGKVECLNEEMDVDLPNGYEIKSFNGVVAGHCNACQHS